MNKTMLWILLAVSAVLFLYPSITILLDVLETIGNAPAISSAVLETRDRAIMQVLGFISLYMFLGALLYSYDNPIQQQRIDDYADQPQPAPARNTSLNIDPSWSLPVGILVTLVAIFLQGSWGAFNASNLMSGLALPVIYSLAAGVIAGLATYMVIINIK